MSIASYWLHVVWLFSQLQVVLAWVVQVVAVVVGQVVTSGAPGQLVHLAAGVSVLCCLAPPYLRPGLLQLAGRHSCSLNGWQLVLHVARSFISLRWLIPASGAKQLHLGWLGTHHINDTNNESVNESTNQIIVNQSHASCL
jgi:hypothetical protein